MENARKDRFHTFLYGVAGMVKGGRIQPQWLKDGDSFCYLDDRPGHEGLYRVEPPFARSTCLLDQAGLLGILGAHFGENIPLQEINFGGIRLADDEAQVVLPIGEQEYRIDVGTHSLQAASPPPGQHSHPRRFAWVLGNPLEEGRSPDGKLFLGVEDGNLYVRAVGSAEVVPLTTDGSPNFPYDVLGACWSADSRWVAVHRLDVSRMPRIAVTPYLKEAAAPSMIPWATAGEEMWGQEACAVDIANRQVYRLPTSDLPADDYISLAAWAGEELLVGVSDRRCKIFTLAACRPGGATRTLLVERAETFHNYNQFTPLPIRLLPSGGGFLWLSERDGRQRIYRYDMQGDLLGCLSGSDCEVRQIVQLDEAGGWVCYLGGPPDAPGEQHLYRAWLDGSGSERLTQAPGVHEVQFSPSGRYFLDTHSTLEQPYRVSLHRADGNRVLLVSEMDAHALHDLGWQPPEAFWVTALDGHTPLRGVLYKPADFDPLKQYPVVEYIYGGPHSSDATTSFYGFSTLDALAQAGFIVFVVDGPGTSGRGKAFQDACYGRLGSYEIPEHVHALRQLAAARPYMDLDRVGIFGLSYGGYLTLRAILTAPETYHVAVATCPPPGVKEMVWAYVERYMDLPQENPQGYQDGDCLSLAGSLQGRLLIMHGTSDTNAAILHTMRMAEAFIQAGKNFDLVCFPDQGHLFEGAAQKYWLDRIHDYFVEHLHP